jgi:hypothetical protein
VPTPSTSRFAVLATQFSSVAPDSSVRSPVASSYQVNRGVVGSRRTAAAKAAGIVSIIGADDSLFTLCDRLSAAGQGARNGRTVSGVAVNTGTIERRTLASGLAHSPRGVAT